MVIWKAVNQYLNDHHHRPLLLTLDLFAFIHLLLFLLLLLLLKHYLHNHSPSSSCSLFGAGKNPWSVTFSYGRALQASVLAAWKGKPENVVVAQSELLKRAKANGEASMGQYAGGVAGTVGGESLFQAGHAY